MQLQPIRTLLPSLFLLAFLLCGLTWQQSLLPDCQSGTGLLVYNSSTNSITCSTAVDFSSTTSVTTKTSAAYAPTADGSVGYDTTRDSYVAGSTIGATGTTGYFPRMLSMASDNTDTLDAATITTTETVFTKKFAVPADFLIANKALEVRAAGIYSVYVLVGLVAQCSTPQTRQ
jgi:hypothetical protein